MGIGIIMGTAALLLLVACANIAGMMTVRSYERRREVAVRLAIGAGGGRLARQMLVESVLLALIGGAGGILLASAGTAGLSTIAFPIDATITLDATPDLGVLVASFVLATLTGVLFGLGPALRSARTDLTTSLKEGAQGARLSHKKTAFLVGQLALSTLLLLTAGLFLRSYLAVADVPLGFEADGVTVASLSLATHGYSEEEGRRFCEELIDRVRAAPGVESASLGRFVLLGGTNASNRGRAVDAGQDAPDVNIPYNVVDPEYFRTNRMELVAGRFLTPSDAGDTPYVAVVNQTLAQRLWPDQPAIGRSFRVGRREHEVVGVVRDGVYVFVYEDRRAFAYYPFGQRYGGSNTLHVRSAAPAAATSAAIRAIVNDLDPNVGVAHVRTMGEVVSSNGFIVRFIALLTTLFAAIGLLLAAIGVYGLLAVQVAQRSREFGVRIALGARTAQVLLLVVGRGAGAALLGCAIGIALAIGTGRLLASLLYEVSPFDVLTFILVPTVLLATAIVASVIPARRATRVSPIVTLREE